jgi:hypothetical protein
MPGKKKAAKQKRDRKNLEMLQKSQWVKKLYAHILYPHRKKKNGKK